MMKLRIFGNEVIKKTIKYGIVGILNTIVGYLVYFILIRLKVNLVVSLIVSYLVGIMHSFIWNKKWTFKSDKMPRKEFTKFLEVYVFCFFINLILIKLFTDGLIISKEIAQFIAMCIITVISYIANYVWTFNEKKVGRKYG